MRGPASTSPAAASAVMTTPIEPHTRAVAIDSTALMQAMETGAGRSILRLPTADEATVLKRMDRYALLAQAVR